MKQVFNAKINWVSKGLGGRQTLPSGNKYGPIAIIKGCELNLQEEQWSLIVENKEIISPLVTIAEVRYLSDKAPDNLGSGVAFELYEGIRLVAEGIIL